MGMCVYDATCIVMLRCVMALGEAPGGYGPRGEGCPRRGGLILAEFFPPHLCQSEVVLRMRIAAYSPKLVWSPDAKAYSHQLSFDCPRCGPPYRILICCKLTGEPSPGVWVITLPDSPSGDGWNGVTVRPSIQNNDHGRKKTCGHHCSVVDGELVP